VVTEDQYQGILIYSISEPTQPQLFGFYRTIGRPESAYIFSDYLYVADGEAGLNILQFSNVTGIKESKQNLAESFLLKQNYPNPFNPTTTITYEIPKASEVNLTIYNTLGQKIRTLINRKQNAGKHEVIWDGKDEIGNEVASGIYLYQLRAGDFVQTRKMILMR